MGTGVPTPRSALRTIVRCVLPSRAARTVTARLTEAGTITCNATSLEAAACPRVLLVSFAAAIHAALAPVHDFMTL